ncbi:MAG: protein kinase [candidate division KSB1 bacterium]|nr:protein kinase [candidate division KSB1 bacterium]
MIETTIFHYRIIDKLGEGGMGVVYKAEDTRLKRFVALKFLPTNLTTDVEAKERFIQEAQAASALDHPNICTIYEINETGEGQLFIAMAFYGGETLQKKVGSWQSPVGSRQLPVSSVIDIATQIGKGLAEAHQHGIFHRDIKPANIMVLSDGLVKILDFGLAKLAGSNSITKSGTTLGTAAYMSPEQILGGKVDQRTDIWSLGVVMYEMLTGKPPFRGEHDQSIVYAILHETPEPISKLRPEVSSSLEQIIARALIKDQEMRYASVNELLQALENLQLPKGATAQRKIPDVSTWENTIVVLDFTNITGNPADDWLAGGIAETVTVDFKRISALRVISREMVARAIAQLPQQKVTEEKMIDLGNMLKVRWIVWGAYQKLGDTIRITARCTEVATGSLAGSAKVDGTMDDIFKLQDQLITALMDSLNLVLSRSEIKKIQIPETIELKAYEYYAKGRQLFYQFNIEGFQEAQNYYEKAIALDPNYALAYSGLGSSYIFRFIAQTNPQDLELGMTYLQKALQLDPELAEPYLYLAYAYFRKEQFDESIQMGLRAVELEPNDHLSFYYLAAAYWGNAATGLKTEHYADAIRQFKKAYELQPNYIATAMNLGYLYMLLGQYHEAQTYLDRAVEIEDSGKTVLVKFFGGLTLRGNLALRRHEFEQAIDYYQRSLVRLEGIQHVYRESLMAQTYCGLGQVNFCLKNYDQALACYQKAVEMITAAPKAMGMGYILTRARLGLARVYHQLGQAQEASAQFNVAATLFRQKQGYNFNMTWEGNDAHAYYDFASYHALVNHPEEALECLQKAVQCGWADLPTLETEESFELVRDNLEFQKMVQDLKTRKPLS